MAQIRVTVSRYLCTDCGVAVVAIGRVVVPWPPVCCLCGWLNHEFRDDPAGREAMRKAVLDGFATIS